MTEKDNLKKENLIFLFKHYIKFVKRNPYSLMDTPIIDELLKICKEAINRYDELFELDGDNSQVNRWLGYIQGVLITYNIADVELEWDFSQPYLTAHRKEPL